MDWRECASLLHLRAQVDKKFPNRSRSSDGTIGDLRHQNERTSDHNPWVHDSHGQPIVTAIDITHDPLNGFNSYVAADEILGAQDHRLKYVISNHRIGSGPAGPSPGKWRPYTGTNAHDHHVHISVMAVQSLYDDTADWDFDSEAIVSAPDPDYVKPPATIRLGSSGALVKTAQTMLNAKGAKLAAVDGIFGNQTRNAVMAVQQAAGVVADGIVGPQTWALLSK